MEFKTFYATNVMEEKKNPTISFCSNFVNYLYFLIMDERAEKDSFFT